MNDFMLLRNVDQQILKLKNCERAGWVKIQKQTSYYMSKYPATLQKIDGNYQCSRYMDVESLLASKKRRNHCSYYIKTIYYFIIWTKKGVVL